MPQIEKTRVIAILQPAKGLDEFSARKKPTPLTSQTLFFIIIRKLN
jgi:hypothetical protein